MRDSSIIRGDYNSTPEVIKIDEKPVFDDLDYDLMDEKDSKKYIDDCKRLIRNSFEYREMVKYLRENMDMDQCSLYENVNNRETFKIKIHLHHHPFTLEDICRIVFKKRLQYGEELDTEDIAYEVMSIHYNCLVGLIPLSETVHELVHNKYIFIPMDKVYGKWLDFYNMYQEFMDEEMIATVQENIERSKNYVANDDELGILKQKYIYIDSSDLYDTPDDREVIEEMNQIVDDINKGNQNLHKVKRKMLKYPNQSNNSIF